MQISQRGIHIQASPIRKLKPYADRAEAKGIHIYHLNIGDPDVPTPKPVLDAFHTYNEKVIGYGPSQGGQELRQAIADYFGDYHIALGADDIIVTVGGSEAILFAFSAVGDPGDEILIPEPYYTNYNGYASLASVRIGPIPLKVEDGFRLHPGKGHRGADHPEDEGDPPLLAEQPHRDPVFARRAGPGRPTGH